MLGTLSKLYLSFRRTFLSDIRLIHERRPNASPQPSRLGPSLQLKTSSLLKLKLLKWNRRLAEQKSTKSVFLLIDNKLLEITVNATSTITTLVARIELKPRNLPRTKAASSKAHQIVKLHFNSFLPLFYLFLPPPRIWHKITFFYNFYLY